MATAHSSRSSNLPLGVARRRDRAERLRRVLALLAILLLFPLPYSLLNPAPAHAQAQGFAGGFVELTSVFFGEGTRSFGRGQIVTVSGSIPSIPWCPSMTQSGANKGARGEGPLDFFPVADFYVLKDDGNALTPFQPLVDVNGKPNRITGGPQGVFVEEQVAITQPAGNLGPGRYKIVMDQCLTGLFDPYVDIVLGDPPNLGFEVLATGALPTINYHLLKDRAKDLAEELSGTKLGALGVTVEIPGFCKLYGKLVDKVPRASFLFGFGKIALDRCSDLIAEQKGIAADPPDPNYKQFAELGSLSYDFTDAPQTALERAARDLAHALVDQAAINKALLTSVERFQGAQVASDDEYTILQMQAASRYVDLLIGPGGASLRFYADLEAFDFALRNDPLGATQEAADLHAFIPEMRQAIGGLLRPLGTALDDVRANGVDTFTPVGLQEWIAVYVGTDPFLPSEGLPGIPQIRAQNGLPPLSFHQPLVHTTGPFEAPPGRMISFDASKSTDPDGGTLSFTWDFNGTGTFADATGSVVQFSFPQPGTRLVGVKASDPAGNTAVSYALVRIGDVNAQDVIAMPLTRELLRISPGGSFTTLKPGIGFNLGGLLALHVDLNKDIWVLNFNSFEHYDSNGILLKTITLAQVASLLGVPLQTFSDFTLDGRGDILVLAYSSTPPPSPWKLIRLAKDASSATNIADVSFPPSINCLSNSNSPSLAIDNSGNVVVAAVTGPSNLNNLYTQTGTWTVDPSNGSMQQVIPDGACGGLVSSSFGPYQSVRLFFGGNDLFANVSGERYLGGIKVDSRGDYITGFGNTANGLRFYRTFVPAELSLAGFNLGIQVFPLQLVTAGSPYLVFNDFAINSSGDYIVSGYDFAGVLPGTLFRVTPDTSIFPISNASGAFGSPAVAIDVVPDHRAVTPKDLPPDPTVHMDSLSVSQDACPGATQLNATVSNTGSGALNQPVRVLWLDGDPEANGTVIGGALVPVPLAPGKSASVSALWPNPSPGVHEIFAIAMGANTVSVAFQICIPTNFMANPVMLSPLTGTSQIGASYTVTANVVDALGGGLSGIPVAFNVTNANIAAGTQNTDVNGTAPFSYSGTNRGSDNIVATVTGATSNTVTNLWQGAVNTSPIANAGSDQVVEASSPLGAVVNLSGAASSDPDKDPLTFTWTGPFGTLTGINISPILPLGTTKVMLAVNDGHGNTANASVNVTVRDTTPPVVTPPAAIAVAATEAGGARGAASAALAAFLASGAAKDVVDPAPIRLPPQAGSVNVDNNALFATGTTTPVSFRFRDASGNVGSSSANVTVIQGTPRITGSIGGVGSDPSGAIYVNVILTNTGTGNARNLKISTLAFRTLSGTGTVTYNAALSPSLPMTIGNLDVGVAKATKIYVNVPGTVTRMSVTESGPVQDVLGTNFNYSTAEALVP